MGYRSLKRVLGETSIERKCRSLFGVCLLFLIGSAFWSVDSIVEDQVFKETRIRAQDLTNVVMIKSHATFFETREPRYKEYLQGTMKLFDQRQHYTVDVVTLYPDAGLLNIGDLPEVDEEEKKLLLELERLVESQRREQAEAETVTREPKELDPPSVVRVVVERDEYQYYEAIQWKRQCISCHMNLVEMGVIPPSEMATTPEIPLHAVRVVMPFEDTREAINKARAILIAVAILTVFVAMVGLYVIVRYVIVKPLQHLRDVSDQVSQGDLKVRAEIKTEDEFQDLAESFNRMLRHLTDTQNELQRVNTDLDAKVDELAQANMQLYEMNRLKSDFLANMSHELRTPLNSIIGFSEVLQNISSLNDKQKRYAGNIQKSGRMLLEMINDILDLAKLEAGKMEIRPSEFQLDVIVQTQCDIVRTLAEDKNIDLEVQVEPRLPSLFQDQAKVQQILTNLLSNAIKFTPEGGRIIVKAFRNQDMQLELSVEDTGVGIAEEDHEIIFEKFRQSAAVVGQDGLTREYSGTGLGLSIIKEICKLLHGEIHFISELGKGSTFTVVLPWVVPAEAQREREIRHQLNQLKPSAVGLSDSSTA